MKKQYPVIYEWGDHNWSAYSPDVPGCVATGRDRAETERNFKEALEFHFEGMVEDGDIIPLPTSEAGTVEVDVPEVVALRIS